MGRFAPIRAEFEVMPIAFQGWRYIFPFAGKVHRFAKHLSIEFRQSGLGEFRF
jgi:hypothetical protein